MTTLTVTAKGQITLRQELLRHLQIAPGQQIDVAEMPDGELRLKAVRKSGKISDAFGMLKRDGRKALSIEELTDAAAAGWAGEK